jgi:hypothetical protein
MSVRREKKPRDPYYTAEELETIILKLQLQRDELSAERKLQEANLSLKEKKKIKIPLTEQEKKLRKDVVKYQTRLSSRRRQAKLKNQPDATT